MKSIRIWTDFLLINHSYHTSTRHIKINIYISCYGIIKLKYWWHLYSFIELFYIIQEVSGQIWTKFISRISCVFIYSNQTKFRAKRVLNISYIFRVRIGIKHSNSMRISRFQHLSLKHGTQPSGFVPWVFVPRAQIIDIRTRQSA